MIIRMSHSAPSNRDSTTCGYPFMTDSLQQTDLEVLLHHIKQVEVRLDSATEKVEDFCRDNLKARTDQNPELLVHIEREKFEAAEWAKSLDAIIAHKPRDYEELKYKTLVLLDYVEAGHDNPALMKTIKADLRAFAFNDAQNTSNINRKFLLIDDNEIDRMLIRKALSKKREDLFFIELEDGLSVVDVIKKEQPFATLVDIRMPHIDGYGIIKLIREEEDLQNHPIWVLATSSDDRDVKIALKSGANGYFTKPDSIAAYSKLADQILRNSSL